MSYTLHSELCVLVCFVIEGGNEILVSDCMVLWALLLFLFCRQFDQSSTDSCLGIGSGSHSSVYSADDLVKLNLKRKFLVPRVTIRSSRNQDLDRKLYVP